MNSTKVAETARARRERGADSLSIAAGLDVLVLNENEVLVQHGTRSTPSELYRDTELRGFLGRLVARLLEGASTATALLRAVAPEHRADAREALQRMMEAGVVVRAGADPLAAYLGYACGGRALADQSAALVGAGPLGARIAISLTQHGIGTLTLVDPRRPDDISTRFTPLPSGASAAGTAAEALGAALASSRRETTVRIGGCGFEDVDVLREIVSGHDIVIVAFERPQLHLTHLINRLCLVEQKPWLLARIDGAVGSAGPLFVPPDTACYNCYQTLLDTSVPSAAMAQHYRRYLLNGGNGGFFPGLPAHCDIVAGYSALACVHFLANRASFLDARALILDFQTLTLDLEDVMRLPRCPTCGRGDAPVAPPFPARVATASST